MEDEEDVILKNRLIYKDAIIKRSFKKYLQFINILTDTSDTTNSNSSEKIQSAYISLIKDLSNFELGIQKATTISETSKEELQYYETLFKQKELEIENEKQEILKLKERLAYEKTQRQYKEQYLALYKLINEKPSIDQTEKEIEIAQKELNEISDQTLKTNNKLELRSKQFQLLLHTLGELEKNLDDDNQVIVQQQQSSNMATSTTTTTDNNVDKMES
ncbi:hypothetical protein CYY_000081 [Polysphondylium violaceum]|uniref:THO complex subunit 7 n=1 Tax=Polysphondylium violaceum TaxID=133409 RepID=A0A8J4QBL2_9MYCE|nr:hypothetical protein CYY_000081 [Polysphondylium violaceum]